MTYVLVKVITRFSPQVMISFKRFDGSLVNVDQFWTTSSYDVAFLSETDQYILLRDIQGTVVSIAKSVFRSNHQEVPSGDVSLDPSLYDQYFKNATVKHKRALDLRLLKQLSSILTRQELVIETPEYYLIRPYWLASAMTFGGACHASLGAMLQAWSTSNLLVYHDVEAHRFTSLYHSGDQSNEGFSASKPHPVKVSNFMLIQVNGSPLSGTHSALGWCLDTKAVYLIQSGKDGGRLPGSLIENFRKVSEVAKSVQLKLEKELVATEQLLQKIEHPM
jgi:hypothetical protein